MHVILVKNYVFFWTKACKSSLVLAIVRPQHAIILQTLQNNLYGNGIIVICDAFFCDNRGVLVRKCNVLKLQHCINLLLFFKIIFAIRFYRLVVHQSILWDFITPARNCFPTKLTSSAAGRQRSIQNYEHSILVKEDSRTSFRYLRLSNTLQTG
jgi:hypothetical protein